MFPKNTVLAEEATLKLESVNGDVTIEEPPVEFIPDGFTLEKENIEGYYPTVLRNKKTGMTLLWGTKEDSGCMYVMDKHSARLFPFVQVNEKDPLTFIRTDAPIGTEMPLKWNDIDVQAFLFEDGTIRAMFMDTEGKYIWGSIDTVSKQVAIISSAEEEKEEETQAPFEEKEAWQKKLLLSPVGIVGTITIAVLVVGVIAVIVIRKKEKKNF